MDRGERVPRRPFAGRRVVLGVTGGIAAYKSVQLARDLAQAGTEVDVVLSAGGREFVRPLSFEALTGRRAYESMYEPGEPLTHIRLAREADAVVVAPATANFIARAAAGLADDLLSAILLATHAPVLICPAMNDRMYAHPQTRSNLERLSQIGYRLVGPAVGPLAWGEGEGPGRLVEPSEILEHVARELESDSLTGRRLLVTAGPTREPIDPVRFIGNRSSGRMGYAVAAAGWRRGARVTLISGPSALPAPSGVDLVRVETADDMLKAVSDRLPQSDALVMAAAVSDFAPADPAGDKLKKGSGLPRLELRETPDVLSGTRALRPPGAVVVGFALETESVVENARAKLASKELDLLVANDATESGAGFEVETNRVTLLDRDGGIEPLPLMSKDAVADLILDRIGAILNARSPA